MEHTEWKCSLLPSLALNFAVIYSSPGNLALFLFADALGQPDRLRGAADQNQELMKYKTSYTEKCIYTVYKIITYLYL